MKKNLAVVLCGTSNMIFAIATTIINFKKCYKGSDYEFVIFSDGNISQKDIDLIKSINETKFIKYNFPLEKELSSKNLSVKHFTNMVFAKFECFKLLNEYKTVIFTDYDIVILDDISELEKETKEGIKAIINEKSIISNFTESIEEYDMEKDSMNGGLFVLQDKLKNYNDMYNFCYSITKKYYDKLFMPEQVAFSLMLQEFNINPEKLNPDIYCLIPNQHANFPKAKILHSYGFHKFWNGIKDNSFNLWNANYKEWIRMGGSKYKKRNEILYKILLKISWLIPVRKWRDEFRLKFM